MQELFSPVDGEIIHPSMTLSPYHYIFDNSELFTSKSESPRVADVKNDYVIWGTKKGVNGDLPIHARYAVDKKPKWYRSLGWINSIGQEDVSRLYYTAESEKQEENGLLVDWRELIYRMAIDFYQLNQEDNFLYKVQENNPWAIDGKTGYEQYYSDIQGFWR
jgi:hypothetical protein